MRHVHTIALFPVEVVITAVAVVLVAGIFAIAWFGRQR